MRVGSIVAGRYHLQQLLGSGAYTQAYLATDLTLSRVVVLKMLHPRLAAGEAADAFHQYLAAGASLLNRRIVPILDSGYDGSFYAVGEFCPGGSLRAQIEQAGPLSSEDVAAVGIEALRALELAHSAGVLHLGLKPENLLFDSEGRLKVSDFAFSRVMGAADMTLPLGETLSGMRYLSPEQVRGGEIAAACDIYALGLLLAEAAIGRAVLRAGEKLSALSGKTYRPGEVASSLGPLAEPLLRATSLSPHDRYASPGEMARDLAEAAGIDMAREPALAGALANTAGESSPALSIPAWALSSAEGPSAGGSVTADRSKGAALPAAAASAEGGLALATREHVEAAPSVPLTGPPTGPLTGPPTGPLTGPPTGPPAGHPEGGPLSGGRSPDTLVDDSAELFAAIWAGIDEPDGPPGDADEDGDGEGGGFLDSLREEAGVKRGGDSVAGWRHRRKSRMGVRLGVALLAVAVLAGVLWAQGEPAPAVVGENIETAREKANASGLGLVVDREEPTSSYAAGTVLAQSPAPGQTVRFRQKIHLTVAGGPPPKPVPSITGNQLRDATGTLGRAGFVPVVVVALFDQAPAGQILRQEPQAGEAPLGSSIRLTISAGPAPVAVPDLAGKSREDAEAALAELGFAAQVEQEFSETVKQGMVISTQPAASGKLRPGATVTVAVSKGPPLVTLPDVRGSRVTDAASKLQALGLTVKLVQIVGQEKVVSMSPAAGAQVKKGSTVTLTTG